MNCLGNNSVVFDLLRPNYVTGIGNKFLQQLAKSALDKYQLRLEFEDSIITFLRLEMEKRENLLFGGRQIKTLLETLVERPLNRWIFENYPDLHLLLGQSLSLFLDSGGNLTVIRNESTSE